MEKYNEKTFEKTINGEKVQILCHTAKTKTGWKQHAEMGFHGYIVRAETGYTNRQWESFEYEKVLKMIFSQLPLPYRRDYLFIFMDYQ